MDRLPPSIRVVADPTDGATDVQRQVDIQKACRLFGQTGDYSELVQLGIFSVDANEDDEDKT